MNTNLPRTSVLKSSLAVVLGLTVGASTALATPYASSLTNNAGVISFRLNEDASNVKVVGNGGAVTNDLGPLPRGLTVTNLSASISAGTFQVIVTKTGATGQIQTNAPPVPFNSPRGVAVNNNPASPLFGRIYVANSTNGIKGDGIFIYDADLNDTFGQGANPRTGGLDFVTSDTTAKPWRIAIGDSDKLYICDWSDPTGNLYVTDPDVTSSGFALQPLTGTAVRPVTSANNHGSVSAVAVSGTLGVDLTIYTVDEDLTTDRDTALNEMNSLWQYPVGTGTLPTSIFDPSYKLATPDVNFVSQTMDLARGTNGYLYMSQYRSAGSQPAVYVVDPAVGLLTNTLQISQALGETVDILRATAGVSVSHDGKWLAVANIEDNAVIVTRLESGIPNLARRVRFTGFGGGSGRGLAFDRANNLLVISTTQFQSISFGVDSVAVTGSDGTFSLSSPPQVYVTCTNSPAREQGPVAATFTFVREGDTSGSLTVNYTISGSASNGVDYPSIASPGSITFLPGEAVTNITVTPIDDSLSELNETVVLTLNAGGGYSVIDNNTASMQIIDNDPPLVTIAVARSSMYEPHGLDSVSFTVSRGGDPSASDLTVNLTYSGTATPAADYNSASPLDSVYLGFGETSATIVINPVDDPDLEGNESIIANIAASPNYVIGAQSSATATLIDNEHGAEFVLFSDNFETDTSASWSAKWGSANGVQDYTNLFSFDYSTVGIPAPPGTLTTRGLLVSVNKADGVASAAGVNLYPNGQNFSGDYALKFSMYIEGVNGGGTTEHVIFGINHSGTKTNWATRSTTGAGITGRAGGDGLWINVVADASGFPGGNDYGMFSYPTPASNPTVLASKTAASSTGTFKLDVFRFAGSPSSYLPGAKTAWVDVEVRYEGGIASLWIDGVRLLQYTNTTGFNSGNIMVGYNDAFNSIGGGAANTDLSLGGYVIYDNLRVVSLAKPNITETKIVGGNVEITFTDGGSNGPWTLQSAIPVTGTFTNLSATISTVSPGVYKAVTPYNGAESMRYYRIQR